MKMSRQWLNHPVYSKYKLILISDISFDNNQLIWHAEGKTPVWVIEMLNKSFVKLETMQSRIDLVKKNPLYADSTFSTIWDMIIAEEAEIFLTCNEEKNHDCLRCTRARSNYVNEILKVRESARKLCVHVWSAPNQHSIQSCKHKNMKYFCC